jgi:hypothetical protein
MQIGTGKPGPLFHKLIDAFGKYVGVDLIKQAKSHLA